MDEYHVIRYFLNETLTHHIVKEKAKYRYDDIRKGKIQLIYITHLPSLVVVKTYSFINGYPIGKWAAYNKRAEKRYVLNFDEISYINRDGFVPQIDYPPISDLDSNARPAHYAVQGEELKKALIRPSVLPREYRLNDYYGKGKFRIQIHVDKYGVVSHVYILESVKPCIDYMLWQNLKKLNIEKAGTKFREAVDSSFELEFDIDIFKTEIQQDVEDWKRR
jgi:hypothetical protein